MCLSDKKRSVIVLLIRGKALKVQNELRSVRLVFEEAEMKVKLIWCLKDIPQDIEGQEPRDPGPPRAKKRTDDSIEGYEDEHIEACVRELKCRGGYKASVL